MKNIKVFKGNIAFSTSPQKIETYLQNYLVIEDGTVKGIYPVLPEQYKQLPVIDLGNKIVVPGFTDLHVHAPQFYQRGMGLDMELIEWLEKYTFQQEKQFSDLEYAKKVYNHFADELVRNGTVCASIFATIHKPATEALFDILSTKGIYALVGKVNMDRNSPDGLREETDVSIEETEELIQKYVSNPRIKPILTPRFVPTCSETMLEQLGQLASKYNVPVQSHLSENRNEVKWVQELHPDHPNYSSVYNRKGLFGQTPTLMAHCIYVTDEEIELMNVNGVVAVHCPESNLDLSSGIMPVRKVLKAGVKVGLGSDVGGGHNISMTKAIVRTIQMSKVLKVYDPENEPFTFEEAFYMATKGGGSFFGKFGSFEEGYSFSAIVIDDSSLGDGGFSLKERLQRFVYIGDDRNISDRYVDGHSI